MWLLDTNAWIHVLNSSSPKLTSRFEEIQQSDVFLCDIVKAELYYGSYRSMRVEENVRLLENLFSLFESKPFDGEAAQIAGKVRAELADKGTPIGPNDLLIAATAIGFAVLGRRYDHGARTV